MPGKLTLYHRHDCHLCDQMLAEIRALYGDGLDIELVDVASDAALDERYGLVIPVLAAGGRELCHGRLDRERLEAYLLSI